MVTVASSSVFLTISQNSTAAHKLTTLLKLVHILKHKLHLHLAALGWWLRNKHTIPPAEFTSKSSHSSAYRAQQQIKLRMWFSFISSSHSKNHTCTSEWFEIWYAIWQYTCHFQKYVEYGFQIYKALIKKKKRENKTKTPEANKFCSNTTPGLYYALRTTGEPRLWSGFKESLHLPQKINLMP